DAVAPGEIRGDASIPLRRDETPVGCPRLHTIDDRVGAALQIDLEARDVMRARPPVEAISFEHDRPTGNVLRRVVRRRTRQRCADPFRVVRETGRNGADAREVHEEGAVRVRESNVIVPRVAVIPDGDAAFPSSTSWAPTMSVTDADTGDCIFGSRIRSIAWAMSRPVTTAPVL